MSGDGVVCDRSFRKFFVRSLPPSADESSLRMAFAPLGDVEDVVVVRERREDGGAPRSKGYGFVTMRWLEGAAAVTVQPPRAIDGRDIIVQLASAGKDAPPLSGGGGGGSAAPI